MSKKVLIIVSLTVAALLFAACERSAAQPVLATPTAESSNPVSQPTGISLVEAWGTSTAIYQQTAAAQGLVSATPTSGTPQPSLTATPIGTVSTASTSVPPTGAATTPTTGTTPAVIMATATPGRPASYTLHPGEFPYCIARRFNLNPDDLLTLNGLMSQGQIVQPGLVLRIPQTGSFPGNPALHTHPGTYTVTVDDTIYGIACYFGNIDPTSIAAANNLTLSSPLTTGQILNIP